MGEEPIELKRGQSYLFDVCYQNGFGECFIFYGRAICEKFDDLGWGVFRTSIGNYLCLSVDWIIPEAHYNTAKETDGILRIYTYPNMLED